MASLNKVYLIGHIVGKPEVRTFNNNYLSCHATIECFRTVKKKDSTHEERERIPVIAFRRQAEELENCYNHNRMVHIEGRLHLNEYVKHSGETVGYLEVIAEKVFFDEEVKPADASATVTFPVKIQKQTVEVDEVPF